MKLFLNIDPQLLTTVDATVTPCNPEMKQFSTRQLVQPVPAIIIPIEDSVPLLQLDPPIKQWSNTRLPLLTLEWNAAVGCPVATPGVIKEQLVKVERYIFSIVKM